MKIKRKGNLVNFEDLDPGDTFVYEGQSYIKTDKTEYINAVQLANGISYKMKDLDLITKTELEAVEV